MATINTDGSQTATLTTEHTLATITAAGTYVLEVDTAALAAGEILTLRVYGKVRSGGTERLMDALTFMAPMVEGAVYTIAYPVAVEIRFSLQQDGGTGRAFPWAVYSV